jgi:hypothetical protein
MGSSGVEKLRDSPGSSGENPLSRSPTSKFSAYLVGSYRGQEPVSLVPTGTRDRALRAVTA